MTAAEENEINLRDVTDVVLRYKWWITLFIVLVTLGTFVTSLVLPKKYEASVVISPVANSANNGLLSSLNSVMSQFSGLASLAGLSPSTDSTKSESLAVLESEALTEQYINDNKLMPVLYASKWDSSKNTWKSSDPANIPSLWKANQLFKKKIRKITTDAKSGLVTLSITWTNAKTAAQWANDLVRLTNEYRRDKALSESERNIAYLTSEVQKTDVVGVKQAIFGVLQSEISKMMLARGNEEYALKVVDPAVAPEKASSPLPAVWTSLALAVSLTISMIFAFFKASLRTSK